jgi:hypothetical protein
MFSSHVFITFILNFNLRSLTIGRGAFLEKINPRQRDGEQR